MGLVKLHIYFLCYNESYILPFFFDFYKSRFPLAEFTMYDNQSTDDSVRIAKLHGAEVISFDTNNKIVDSEYLKIKNNCWKKESGWVLVCDADEWLDINEQKLSQVTDVDIFKSVGFNMCNVNNEQDLLKISHGVRSYNYDKCLLFRADRVKDISYGVGCHYCNPVGDALRFNQSPVYLRHMKYLDGDRLIKRYNDFSQRLSLENRQNGLGIHYDVSEEELRIEYHKNIIEAVKID